MVTAATRKAEAVYRLWQDQAGTPEGYTARVILEGMVDKYPQIRRESPYMCSVLDRATAVMNGVRTATITVELHIVGGREFEESWQRVSEAMRRTADSWMRQAFGFEEGE